LNYYGSSCIQQYLLLMVDLHPYSMLHSMHAWEKELPAPSTLVWLLVFPQWTITGCTQAGAAAAWLQSFALDA
jgi:hypothetical protein